jgi:DNA (cytosine-5)-methyltransferase 1
VAGGQHIAEVRAFLVKYYATAVGQSLAEPMHTLTAKARLGLVTVQGTLWQIADIGLRMLQPSELALAQGFPPEYRLLGSKAQQVAHIGNSVPPAMSESLVRANYVEAAVPAMGGVA